MECIQTFDTVFGILTEARVFVVQMSHPSLPPVCMGWPEHIHCHVHIVRSAVNIVQMSHPSLPPVCMGWPEHIHCHVHIVRSAVNIGIAMGGACCGMFCLFSL